MNAGQWRDKAGMQLRDLAAGDTHSITGRRGIVVRCLAGRVWVTQEGDWQDHIVPAGAIYCSAGKGRIVVNADADDTRIAVYRVQPVPAGEWSRNAVRFDADFAGTVHRAARQERARYFAILVCAAWRCVQRAWQRLVRPRSGMAVPPRRSAC
jgi:hypothetical protein